jgi:hypothetical protein
VSRSEALSAEHFINSFAELVEEQKDLLITGYGIIIPSAWSQSLKWETASPLEIVFRDLTTVWDRACVPRGVLTSIQTAGLLDKV